MTHPRIHRQFNAVAAIDYAGGGEDHMARSSLRVAVQHRDDEHPQDLNYHNGRRFSRNSLSAWILHRAQSDDARRKRRLFALDHQFSWPPFLRALAGLEHAPWREFVAILAEGCGNLPPLDIPRRYCRAFNLWAEQTAFWSPLPDKARLYGIGNVPPLTEPARRFRITEKTFGAVCLPRTARRKRAAMPADAVGGQGMGSVGGQTLCGLRQLARLVREGGDTLAFWPFDGLDINDAAYEGRHVVAEIFCTLYRPRGMKKTDANDARAACRCLHELDGRGMLRRLMTLTPCLSSVLRQRVRREGWIIGMSL